MTQEQQDLARHHMWCRLIPGYDKMTYNQKKHAKDDYAFSYSSETRTLPHDFNPMPEDYLKVNDAYKTAIYTDVETITIAPLACPKTACATKPKTKAKAMYYDEFETPIQTRTDEQKKRDYLAERAEDIQDQKYSESRKAFRMDAEFPMTLGELVEKIQAGKFMPLDDKTKNAYVGSVYSIDFHDPAAPKDQAGYDAATASFSKLFTSTMDQIKIADPAAALTAVQALEAWTPTGAAN